MLYKYSPNKELKEKAIREFLDNYGIMSRVIFYGVNQIRIILVVNYVLLFLYMYSRVVKSNFSIPTRDIMIGIAGFCVIVIASFTGFNYAHLAVFKMLGPLVGYKYELLSVYTSVIHISYRDPLYSDKVYARKLKFCNIVRLAYSKRYKCIYIYGWTDDFAHAKDGGKISVWSEENPNMEYLVLNSYYDNFEELKNLLLFKTNLQLDIID